MSARIYPGRVLSRRAAGSTWRRWRAFSRLLLRGERNAHCRRRPARDACAKRILVRPKMRSVYGMELIGQRPQLRRLFLMYGQLTGRIERSLSARRSFGAQVSLELGDLDVAGILLVFFMRGIGGDPVASPLRFLCLLSFSGSSASKREYVTQIPSATAPPFAASPALFSCHLIPRVAPRTQGHPCGTDRWIKVTDEFIFAFSRASFAMISASGPHQSLLDDGSCPLFSHSLSRLFASVSVPKRRTAAPRL